MINWILKVKIQGEWEECRFSSSEEALASFIALRADYAASFEKAVILRVADYVPGQAGRRVFDRHSDN